MEKYIPFTNNLQRCNTSSLSGIPAVEDLLIWKCHMSFNLRLSSGAAVREFLEDTRIAGCDTFIEHAAIRSSSDKWGYENRTAR